MSSMPTQLAHAPLARQARVALVGQLPPPLHGQALAIQQIADANWPDVQVTPVRMAMSDVLTEIGQPRAAKLLRLWDCARRARHVLKTQAPCTLYYPPASPQRVPFLRDALLLRLIRPLAASTVLHFHSPGIGDFATATALRRSLARPYLHADVAIHASNSVEADGIALRARSVRTVPVGVADPNVRALPPAANGPLHLLYVGHLSEDKGVGMLPALAGRLGEEIKLDIVGDWTSEAFRNRTEPKLRALPNVRLHGALWGDAKWARFRDAHLLVFPSGHEAQGLVAVEAMACGLPIVASDIAGLRDVVRDGREGQLCAPGDTEGFYRAVLQIRHNTALWTRFSAAGRARYENAFALETYLDRMHDVFLECAATQPIPDTA